MKNVLILGGTGFVGRHVCEKLVRAGWRVTVPTRRYAQAQHLLHLPLLNVQEMDVHDEAALQRVMTGHDAVVNLVAILHGSPQAFEQVHVLLPQKLARAAVAAGVRQVVHISALGVNAAQPESAPSQYLRSKGRGEVALMTAARGAGHVPGFELSVLRPSVIFGAEDKFLNLFARLQQLMPVLFLAGAEARFQPVWVEDVASAVVYCLAHRVEGARERVPLVLEACGPDVFTLRELAQLAAQLRGVASGHGRPVIGLPEWLGRWQARLMELAPGQPLMSRDNLDSMRVDNIASGTLPGLSALGIKPAALRPIAQDYLNQNRADYGLLGIRQRAH